MAKRGYEEELKYHHELLKVRRAIHGDRPHSDVASSLDIIGAVL
jgi:hypothetical protein